MLVVVDRRRRLMRCKHLFEWVFRADMTMNWCARRLLSWHYSHLISCSFEWVCRAASCNIMCVCLMCVCLNGCAGRLLKSIAAVTCEQVVHVIKTYLLALFACQTANVFVTCSPRYVAWNHRVTIWHASSRCNKKYLPFIKDVMTSPIHFIGDWFFLWNVYEIWYTTFSNVS